MMSNDGENSEEFIGNGDISSSLKFKPTSKAPRNTQLKHAFKSWGDKFRRQSHHLNDKNIKQTAKEVTVDNENSPVDQPQPRSYTLKRHPKLGFGFVAGSEKPVIVRFVSENGPSFNKLLSNDRIIEINGKNVEKAEREFVINLVRNSKNTIILVVCQPHTNKKSALLSYAKKEKLKSESKHVHFAGINDESEYFTNSNISVNDEIKQKNAKLPSNVPNILRVFLANGQTKSFKFDRHTSVNDVLYSLKEKLLLSNFSFAHFALTLVPNYTNKRSFRISSKKCIHILHHTDLLFDLVQRPDANEYKCCLRLMFVPVDLEALISSDPFTFSYYYQQSSNDFLSDRYVSQLKLEIQKQLCALHIQQYVIENDINLDPSLKNLELDIGNLSKFIPPSLSSTIPIRDLKQVLKYYMKLNKETLISVNNALGEYLSKTGIVTATRCKLFFIQLLKNELKDFGGRYFKATLLSMIPERRVILMINPSTGLSIINNIKTNSFTQLVHFDSIEAIDVYSETQMTCRVSLFCGKFGEALPTIRLSIFTEDVQDFVAFIEGYYKIYQNQSSLVKLPNSGNDDIYKNYRTRESAVETDEVVFKEHAEELLSNDPSDSSTSSSPVTIKSTDENCSLASSSTASLSADVVHNIDDEKNITDQKISSEIVIPGLAIISGSKSAFVTNVNTKNSNSGSLVRRSSLLGGGSHSPPPSADIFSKKYDHISSENDDDDESVDLNNPLTSAVLAAAHINEKNLYAHNDESQCRTNQGEVRTTYAKTSSKANQSFTHFSQATSTASSFSVAVTPSPVYSTSTISSPNNTTEYIDLRDLPPLPNKSAVVDTSDVSAMPTMMAGSIILSPPPGFDDELNQMALNVRNSELNTETISSNAGLLRLPSPSTDNDDGSGHSTALSTNNSSTSQSRVNKNTNRSNLIGIKEFEDWITNVAVPPPPSFSESHKSPVVNTISDSDNTGLFNNSMKFLSSSNSIKHNEDVFVYKSSVQVGIDKHTLPTVALNLAEANSLLLQISTDRTDLNKHTRDANKLTAVSVQKSPQQVIMSSSGQPKSSTSSPLSLNSKSSREVSISDEENFSPVLKIPRVPPPPPARNSSLVENTDVNLMLSNAAGDSVSGSHQGNHQRDELSSSSQSSLSSVSGISSITSSDQTLDLPNYKNFVDEMNTQHFHPQNLNRNSLSSQSSSANKKSAVSPSLISPNTSTTTTLSDLMYSRSIASTQLSPILLHSPTKTKKNTSKVSPNLPSAYPVPQNNKLSPSTTPRQVPDIPDSFRRQLLSSTSPVAPPRRRRYRRDVSSGSEDTNISNLRGEIQTNHESLNDIKKANRQLEIAAMMAIYKPGTSSAVTPSYISSSIRKSNVINTVNHSSVGDDSFAEVLAIGDKIVLPKTTPSESFVGGSIVSNNSHTSYISTDMIPVVVDPGSVVQTSSRSNRNDMLSHVSSLSSIISHDHIDTNETLITHSNTEKEEANSSLVLPSTKTCGDVSSVKSHLAGPFIKRPVSHSPNSSLSFPSDNSLLEEGSSPRRSSSAQAHFNFSRHSNSERSLDEIVASIGEQSDLSKFSPCGETKPGKTTVLQNDSLPHSFTESESEETSQSICTTDSSLPIPGKVEYSREEISLSKNSSSEENSETSLLEKTKRELHEILLSSEICSAIPSLKGGNSSADDTDISSSDLPINSLPPLSVPSYLQITDRIRSVHLSKRLKESPEAYLSHPNQNLSRFCEEILGVVVASVTDLTLCLSRQSNTRYILYSAPCSDESDSNISNSSAHNQKRNPDDWPEQRFRLHRSRLLDECRALVSDCKNFIAGAPQGLDKLVVCLDNCLHRIASVTKESCQILPAIESNRIASQFVTCLKAVALDFSKSVKASFKTIEGQLVDSDIQELMNTATQLAQSLSSLVSTVKSL